MKDQNYDRLACGSAIDAETGVVRKVAGRATAGDGM